MDFQAGLIVLIVFVSLFAIWLIFYFIPVGLWFSALVSGVRISLLQLILMRWRKVPPSTIVSSMIESTMAGVELNPNELVAHYLAGGNVTSVVHALVSAQKANIMLDFKMATAIDIAGRDVFEAVQMSVNPKVINTPPVAAVAKDGIQLIAKARVTVRANIRQLVGGAGEETVLARVGEGIAVRIVLRRYLLEARYGLVVVVFRYALFFVEPDDAFGFGLYLFVFRFGSRQLQGIVARIHPGDRFSFAYLLSDGDGNLRNRPADTESEVRLGRCLQFARKTDASFPFASGRFGQFDGSDNLFGEASVPASGQQNRQHQQQDGALFHIFHLLSA